MTKTEIIEKLKVKGFKMTGQRALVLEALFDNRDRLLSVDDLLGCVKKKNEKTNLTTIYRNLEALSSVDVIHKTLLEDQVAYYKLRCGGHHHHHLICTECGAIESIEYCPMSVINTMAQDKNFTVSGHKLEVYGVCGRCSTSR